MAHEVGVETILVQPRLGVKRGNSMNSEIQRQTETFFESLHGVMQEIKSQDETLHRDLVRLFDLGSEPQPVDIEDVFNRCEKIVIEGTPACSRLMESYRAIYKQLPINEKRHRNHELRIYDAFVCIIDLCSWGRRDPRNVEHGTP
jgi:hypothetical protein